jgi:hypothetical protein
MDDLAGYGRVVVTACGEYESSYDGLTEMQNGVFTYYYMEGLYIYNSIESAFAHGAPLATGFMQKYNVDMTPQLYDHYTDDWEF